MKCTNNRKNTKTKPNNQSLIILGMSYGLGLGAIISFVLNNVIYLSIGLGGGTFIGLIIVLIKNKLVK